MKRPNPHTLSPDFRSQGEKSMRRENRIVIHLNEKELEALNRYQKMLGGKSRASICREAIMETVLEGLSENQPTLF